jgi:site-specific recombinase XerD
MSIGQYLVMNAKHLKMQLALDFDTNAVVVSQPPAGLARCGVSVDLNDVRPARSVASPLNARNDDEAISAWVAAKCDDAGAARSGRPANTALAYRREAHRFLLWLQVERMTSLREAALEDCVAYKAFLFDPQPRARWCAPRGAKVGSPEWRPFAGPLSARSCRQALTILSGLFRFLQDQQYRQGNPSTGVAMPRNSTPRIDTGRSLSRSQWFAVERELREESKDFRSRQLSWAARFLYSTGLRLAEISSAACGDLRWIEIDDVADGWTKTPVPPIPAAWTLRVLGKGFKIRDVPVPSELVDELGELLALTGDSNDPGLYRSRPLLISTRSVDARTKGMEWKRMSAQTLYRQLKGLFRRVAERMTRERRHGDAEVFGQASTHWLRHTHCSHSIACGTPVDVVQHNAGHNSLATTSLYCHSGLARRVRESSRLAARRD